MLKISWSKFPKNSSINNFHTSQTLRPSQQFPISLSFFYSVIFQKTIIDVLIIRHPKKYFSAYLQSMAEGMTAPFLFYSFDAGQIYATKRESSTEYNLITSFCQHVYTVHASFYTQGWLVIHPVHDPLHRYSLPDKLDF